MIRHAHPIARRGVAAFVALGLLSAGFTGGAPAAGSSQGQSTAFQQTRTISFYHIHTKETLTVTYKKNGQFVPEALEKINWIMRDWRKNQSTTMDPNTVDIIWEMHQELGSREAVNIISGYRSRDTNEMLRKTRGGQASQSQHITGKAIDISFPDVPLRRMRYSAMIRERGGVGYYPTSGVPFVHVDTARVRHWPRMLRDELALVFPSGRSQHEPADGGPLSPQDATRARARNPGLATEVAAFFDIRNNAGKRPAQMVADASEQAAPPPRLKQPATPAARPVSLPASDPDPKPSPLEGRMAVGAPPADGEALVWTASARPLGDDDEAPAPTKAPITAALVVPPKPAARPADRSSSFSKAENAANRKALDKLVLAALTTELPAAKPEPAKDASAAKAPTPKDVTAAQAARPAPLDGEALAAAGLGSRVSWVQAPLFDEDHPDDSDYNPFPVAPLVTETSSVDDPALLGLVHPDAAKALDLLAEEGPAEPMSLGGLQPQALAAAQAFVKPTDASADTRASQDDAGAIRIAQRSVTTVKR